jgi:hypothetical protein
VVEPVLHAGVLVAEQRLHDREVGEVAAAEQQRARCTEPVGEFAFERVVRGMVAAHEMRGDATGAFARRAVLQGVDHRELLGEAEVVVAAESGQPVAVDFENARRRGG